MYISLRQMSSLFRKSVSGRNVLDAVRKIPPEVLHVQRVPQVARLHHRLGRTQRRDLLQRLLRKALWGPCHVQPDGGQVRQDRADQAE